MTTRVNQFLAATRRAAVDRGAFGEVERALQALGGDLASEELPAFVARLHRRCGDLNRARQALKQASTDDDLAVRLERSWLAYYDGGAEFTLAAAFDLIHSLGSAPQSTDILTDTLQLVGKRLSDEGWLSCARDFLLGALGNARLLEDLAGIAAATGALAEVVALGGHPLAALTLLRQDEALLVPGDIDRTRLLVYHGHAFRMLGTPDADLHAQQRYELAMEVASLGGRANPWADRGLLWCKALRLAARGAVSGETCRELCARAPALGHPGGHARLALAWLARLSREDGMAEQWTEEAARLFEQDRYLHEARWARGEAPQQAPLPRRNVRPPVVALACDAWIGELPLLDFQTRMQRSREAWGSRRCDDGRAWMSAFW